MPSYRISVEGEASLAPSLNDALREASLQCPGVDEEEGGILLVKDDKYTFIKLRNRHTGEPVAVGFFEADPAEYGEKVIPLFNDGHKNFASYHTHPTGCRAMPSSVDLTRLFNGFPTNFISSPSRGELNRFTYDPSSTADEVGWHFHTVKS